MYDDDELGPEDLCRHGKPKFLICDSCRTPVRQWRPVSETPPLSADDGTGAMDLALRLSDTVVVAGWYRRGCWYNSLGRQVVPIEWLALSELVS